MKSLPAYEQETIIVVNGANPHKILVSSSYTPVMRRLLSDKAFFIEKLIRNTQFQGIKENVIEVIGHYERSKIKLSTLFPRSQKQVKE